jgi:hypothetical protein
VVSLSSEKLQLKQYINNFFLNTNDSCVIGVIGFIIHNINI